MSLRHDPRGEAISDDDATIKAALEHASVPCLMMSMIHMSGDLALLDGEIRPVMCFLNDMQCAMSPEHQAEIRRRAFDMIRDYRDRGCTLPAPPDMASLRRMMGFLVAGDVPADYVPMMLEEMELDGRDAREVSLAHVPQAARDALPVLVIGAGMSGILAGIRLQEEGIPYLIIEKNAGVGGTWYENTYPGCRVDVGNHFYCYSFEPNPDWSEYFARQPELRSYFEHCARKYDVLSHIRFGTEVIAANYDEAGSNWQVTVRSAAGAEETLQARVLISSVGQLNRPKLPEIEGLDRFAGPSFHSAQWDHSVDLAGKRIAVIGTGASAFQLVPELARVAQQVNTFQRSPQWMFPNPDYHRSMSDEARWCFRHLPYYGRWYRFLLFWPATDGNWDGTFIDPQWPHQERSANAINEFTREMFSDWIRQQCGDDTALFERVLPHYPPLAKRTLQDNGSWLQALRRDNVELIDQPVTALSEHGVIAANGQEYPADVVVFATGFHANRYLWPMEITGRGGVRLNQQWGDDPAAYLGITVPNFPNLFLMYGPATNLAASGSLIFHGECQMRYIMGCIKLLLEREAGSIEVRREVHDAYNTRLQETLARTIWSHPAVAHSWYRNSQGRVTVLSPWKLLDYWNWTREPVQEEYQLRQGGIHSGL
jgi:4-hydroxyacetophenone monooxygenase